MAVVSLPDYDKPSVQRKTSAPSAHLGLQTRALRARAHAYLGRGDDTVGNPHRAQICQFELFGRILLLKLDKQLHVEPFEATVFQSTVPSPLLADQGSQNVRERRTGSTRSSSGKRRQGADRLMKRPSRKNLCGTRLALRTIFSLLALDCPAVRRNTPGKARCSLHSGSGAHQGQMRIWHMAAPLTQRVHATYPESKDYGGFAASRGNPPCKDMVLEFPSSIRRTPLLPARGKPNCSCEFSKSPLPGCVGQSSEGAI